MKEQKKSHFNLKYFLKKALRLFSRVLFYGVSMLLIFVAFILIIYVFDLTKNANTNKKSIPIFSAYVIISHSMVPTIKVQDAVIIRRVNPQKLKKGDIITFSSSDSKYSGLTITHRIAGITKSKNNKLLFRTKGDNNNVEDASFATADNIYGKVILKIPYIGYLQSFLSNAYGWILLIILPCLIIIVFDLVKLFKIVKTTINFKKNKKRIKELLTPKEEIEILKVNTKKVKLTEVKNKENSVDKRTDPIKKTSKEVKLEKVEKVKKTVILEEVEKVDRSEEK